MHKIKQKLTEPEVDTAARIVNKYSWLAHEIAGGRKTGEGALTAAGSIAVAFLELAEVISDIVEPRKE